jgi:hypothetical protein
MRAWFITLSVTEDKLGVVCVRLEHIPQRSPTPCTEVPCLQTISMTCHRTPETETI